MFRTATLLLAFLIRPLLAHAVTFELNYLPDAVNPSDPDGVGLAMVMESAANRWADIIEDDHVMTINFSYYDNNASGVGPCGIGVKTACAPIVEDSPDQDRTVEGNVLFYAHRNWYIDPTPQDDSEFDLSQTLLADLSPQQASSGYSGSPIEPLLEVGYRGSGNGSDPNVAGSVDMLSTAVHELGHHMGITNQLRAARIEAEDDDYDLPAELLGGTAMAVLTPPNLGYHFEDFYPLMSHKPSPFGSRRLPTAADVLAAAAVSGWEEIDLPRQDYLGGVAWGSAASWVGNRLPGADDAAFIRTGLGGVAEASHVVLDRDVAVESLLVGNGNSLSTDVFSLAVNATTTIEAAGDGAESEIRIQEGGSLLTDHLVLEGLLSLEGGHIEADRISLLGNGELAMESGELSVALFEGNLTQPAGTLSPDGAGIGITELTGAYNLMNGGIQVDITGNAAGPPLPGLDYDQVVAQTAALGGTLEVRVAPETPLQIGDVFSVLETTGGVSGAFDSVLGLYLGTDLGLQLVPVEDRIELHVVASSPGDFDIDSDVDVGDIMLLQRQIGTDPEATARLEDWSEGFGSGSTVTLTVPEPTAVVAVLPAIVAFAIQRQRHNRRTD